MNTDISPEGVAVLRAEVNALDARVDTLRAALKAEQIAHSQAMQHAADLKRSLAWALQRIDAGNRGDYWERARRLVEDGTPTVPPGILPAAHACPDCGWIGTAKDLDDLDDVHDRVAPGEYYPAGQCPECGSLVECTDADVLAAGNVPNGRELRDALAMFVAAVDAWQDDDQPQDASDFIALIETTAKPARAALARAGGAP